MSDPSTVFIVSLVFPVSVLYLVITLPESKRVNYS